MTGFQRQNSFPLFAEDAFKAVFEMRILVSASVFLTMAFWLPAAAQLDLHNGPDAGSGKPGEQTSGGSSAPAKPKLIPMKAPSEDGVVGHDLLRNGASGLVSLSRQGKDLSVGHLALDGEQISKPGEVCHIEVSEGLPLTTHFEGRPDGLARYKVNLPACPFSFDVLEGAVLVPKGQACDFTAADCHVDPAGLWGPQGNTISAARAKDMEHTRIRIESDMRANFRVLLAKAGKDKVSIKKIAGEQAGFSSDRETLCHAYASESVHGFCAMEITRARVLELLAQLGSGSGTQDAAKPRPKKKPKPPSIAAEPPAEQ